MYGASRLVTSRLALRDNGTIVVGIGGGAQRDGSAGGGSGRRNM